VPKYRAQAAVPAILYATKAIAVLDHGSPTREVTFPAANMIVDPDIATEQVAPPAIVVPRDPEHRDARLDEICQRREDPE
jgi:hypothetical protein